MSIVEIRIRCFPKTGAVLPVRHRVALLAPALKIKMVRSDNRSSMNKFVNFKKRGVTLPPGCKDLVDLLRTTTKHETQDARPLTTTRDETLTGVLPDIGKYIRMTFESRGAVFTVVITAPGEPLEVNVVRTQGEEPLVVVTFPSDPEKEHAVRDFFKSRGLDVPEDSPTPTSFFPNLPMQFFSSISPLPTDEARVSALIADLFRQCGRLPDDAKLSFHIVEASDAALKRPSV